MFDLSRLTPEQRQALSLDRHVFVEASAGSGKTAVLVARYLHILATCPDCDPTHILAVTYTRKAAAEMRHRIRQALETAVSNTLEDQIRIQHCLAKLPFATITTIHAFCKDMIADHSHAAGVSPQIQVPSDEDREWAWQRTLESALNGMLAKRDPKLHALLGHQSLEGVRDGLTQLYKRDEISKRFSDREHDDTHHSSDLHALFQEIRILFQAEKQRMGWLDFPDMIAEMAALVERDAEVAADIHSQYRFVMVDEFQDTDRVQWQLFKNLFLQDPPRNLFLVGDLKQAIYRFRGAEPLLFAEVRKWMLAHGGIVVALTQNFRSQQPLITFSNRLFTTLFESSPTVDYAALQAVKKETDRHVYIGLATTPSRKTKPELETPEPAATSEINLITSWIMTIKEKHMAEWSDFAILCRKTSGLTRMGEQLEAVGIPVQQQQQNAVNIPVYYQDMYLLTKLLVYPHDPLAWTGVLRAPLIGMSDNDLVDFHRIRVKEASLSAALETFNSPQFAPDSPQAKAALLRQDIMTLRQHYPLGKSLALLCHRHQWLSPQQLGYDCSEQDTQNLLSKIELWDSHLLLSDPDRLERLEKWLLAGDMHPLSAKNDGIHLMTIHKSKGLEFPFVIVPECGRTFHASRGRKLLISDAGIVSRMPGQDEAFKTHMASEENESMDEEKRIFYVACTRAKEELLLAGTVKLTEEFAEDFVPGSFWEFLAPYATVEERTIHLNLPSDNTEDSPILSCQRWTDDTPMPDAEAPHILAPQDDVSQGTPRATSLLDTPKIPTWDTLMGTLIHQILAAIWQLDSPPTPSDTETLIAHHLRQQFGESADTILNALTAPINTHIHNTLQSPLAESIFASSPKYSEWPFSWADAGDKNTPRDGRIDLLFHHEGRWHIVDFKSTDIPEVTPEMLQTLILYQKAAAFHLKIPVNEIQTSVFFTNTGEWVGL